METTILTTGDVAKYCGVNFRTVLRWIKRGLLKAYQLPGRGDNRIDVKDFMDFLKQHRMPIPDAFAPFSARILVCGEEARTREIIARLSVEGYDVHLTSHPYEVGAALATFSPSTVIVDVESFSSDVCEFIGFLRDTGHSNNTKTVVVTSDATIRKDVLKAGCDAIISSLSDPERLITILSDVMETLNLDSESSAAA